MSHNWHEVRQSPQRVRKCSRCGAIAVNVSKEERTVTYPDGWVDPYSDDVCRFEHGIRPLTTMETLRSMLGFHIGADGGGMSNHAFAAVVILPFFIAAVVAAMMFLG